MTQASQLETMYEKVKTLDACLMMQFPTLELPDASLVVSAVPQSYHSNGNIPAARAPPLCVAHALSVFCAVSVTYL